MFSDIIFPYTFLARRSTLDIPFRRCMPAEKISGNVTIFLNSKNINAVFNTKPINGISIV